MHAVVVVEDGIVVASYTVPAFAFVDQIDPL
jgi:hypothetical protein